MKRILFAVGTLLAVAVVAPSAAKAQILVTPNPGLGVVVGPLAVGIWPGTWGQGFLGTGPNWGGYTYGPGCRVVRTRAVRRHGTVVWRTRRVCG